MEKSDILHTIRSGEGELRPIVDHYAANGRVCELTTYLSEKEIRPTLLYIISELPSVLHEMSATSRDLEALADILRLTEWLDAHVPQLGDAPLTTELLHGGTSNVVLTLNRGGESMVLRRPPPVPPPGAERGVMREARVLTALNRTKVSHPYCQGVCEDPAVVGMPFDVMEKVDDWAGNLRGDSIHNPPPFDRMPFEYGLAYDIVDGLAQLASVDYKAIGLETFGKPDNFLERQAATAPRHGLPP